MWKFRSGRRNSFHNCDYCRLWRMQGAPLSVVTSVAWFYSPKSNIDECQSQHYFRFIIHYVWTCQIRAHTKVLYVRISGKSFKRPKYTFYCHRPNNTDRHIKSNLSPIFYSSISLFMTENMNSQSEYYNIDVVGAIFQFWHLFLSFERAFCCRWDIICGEIVYHEIISV